MKKLRILLLVIALAGTMVACVESTTSEKQMEDAMPSDAAESSAIDESFLEPEDAATTENTDQNTEDASSNNNATGQDAVDAENASSDIDPDEVNFGD